ncbi:MAG: LCP family protein [Candidatus Nanopelagicales bacterium]
MSDDANTSETPEVSAGNAASEVAPEPHPNNAAQPKKKRHWGRIFAGFVAMCILAATGVSAFGFYFLNQLDITADQSANWQSTRTAQPGDPINIILMGSDTREGKNSKGYGKPHEIEGARSDTTIILHVSGDRTRALAVSIPRDMMVDLPMCKNKQGEMVGGYRARINEAFDLGGPSCTVKTIEEQTGIKADHFAVVDFAGFKGVVNALDGVEVCLEKAVYDKDSKLDLPAGKSVVKGEQALAFVRARKALSDGSDISRIERQQEFLSSAMRKAISLDTIKNPVKLYQVLEAATKTLTVDPGLASMEDMQELAINLSELRPDSVTFATVPFVYNDDMATVSMSPQAEKLWSAIKNDQPWPPKKKSTKTKDGSTTSPTPTVDPYSQESTEDSKARTAAKQICAS